jgi:hypothetical protein
LIHYSRTYKRRMSKSKKILLIISGIIIIIVLVVFIFISPMTKYLIQKYDEKYTGRKITLSWAYVNPFTGYIHLSHLKIFEYKSDSVFISMNGLSANVNLFKLISGTVKLNNLTFDQPMVRIVQRKNDFNFNDFKTTFSSKDTVSVIKPKKPFHFYFLNIKINEGHFYYIDEVIPVNFSIKNVDIESKDGWRWDKDTISANVSFLSEIGTGGMKGNFGMNLKSLFYNLDVIVNNFDLNVLEQYMKQIANYGSFRATFDANVKTNGCFREAENINIKGDLAIHDFHFGKNPAEDYVSFDTLVFNMNEVNPQLHKYFIDSVLLTHPYFKYEIYDYGLDNAQAMFGKAGSKASAAISDRAQFNLIFAIGEYIKKLAKNFFHSYYKINHLAINKADLNFNDYSLSEKFGLELDPLTIIADSVDKNNIRASVSLESVIKPYGNISVMLTINPKDTGYFDLNYNIQKVPITIFNPYLITYTSFPLDRGTIELKGTWNVRNNMIQSVNHVLIIDPRLTKRLINKDNKWIPMPFVMSLIRERGNVIDYEIPITGNLKSPKFHFHDVIIDVIRNIFVKPINTAYIAQVKNVETEIEKSLTMKWNMRQSKLLPAQKKFINMMTDYLAKNPNESITVYPQTYAKKEKEYILYYEAKKVYYLAINKINAKSFNEEDSEKVDKMSAKDSSFVRYLNKQVNDTMLFTIQEKCYVLVDSAQVNAKLERLNRERETAFINFFKEKKVDKQVKFSGSENVIPYNGFSYFKIAYKGEIPKSLTKAYQEMNELNDEAPRKKFKKERQSTGQKVQ